MNNFVKRSITGFTFVAITLVAIILSEWTFFALFLAFNIFAQWEFLKILRTDKAKPSVILSIILGTSGVILSFLNATGLIPANYFAFLVPLLLLVFLAELFSMSEFPAKNISYSFLSLIYVSIPFCLSIYLAFGFNEAALSYNYLNILGIFVLIWTNDTMAYLIGVNFGKNRLFERVSPKKSWEGFIGGGIFAVALAVIFYNFSPLFDVHWIAYAVIIVVFGTLGDLLESMFKRNIEVKDSGKILPGHGGILDRFDSFLFAVPWLFFYVMIFG